jgi:hypothetical protein
MRAIPKAHRDGWRFIPPGWLVILLGLAWAVFSFKQACAANGVNGQSDWCTVSQSGVLFCDYSSYQTCMANGHGDACVPNPER